MSTQSNSMPESFDSQKIAPAAMSATRPLYWSIRRELWENRSIYIAPLAAAVVFLLGFFISMVSLRHRMHGVWPLDSAQGRDVFATPYDLAAGSNHGDRSYRGRFLYSRRVVRRAPRSQYSLLEVATGFRSHHRALEARPFPLSFCRFSVLPSPLPRSSSCFCWAA